MRSHIVLALIGCLVSIGSAVADPIYRWVGADGVVNYGSDPPGDRALGKTLREVDATPAVVVHGGGPSPDRDAEFIRELRADREARDRQRLLEAQIAAEEARRQAYLAQAQRPAGSNSCETDYDSGCTIVVYAPTGRARPTQGPRPARQPGPLGGMPSHRTRSLSVVGSVH